MGDHRRVWIWGAKLFLTVNLAERQGNRLLVDQIDRLGSVCRQLRERRPLTVDALLVLAGRE